ncbi:MAG: hypothetical protein ACI4GV_09675, partial [Acutalibacteraceae bacterium]
NYVGTCGCGEPKPFEFEFTPSNNAPVKAPEPPKPVVNTSSYNPAEKISRKPVFTQADNSSPSDSWTCPNCGKVMPNYVGTCGCGEQKPFGDFVDEPAQSPFSIGNIPINSSETRSNLPDIQKIADTEPTEDTYETEEQFSNVEPSLPSYNPQLENQNNQAQDSTQPNFDFIKNDSVKTGNFNNYNDTPAPDLSFIKPSDSNFSNSEQPIYPNAVQPPIEQPICHNTTTPTAPSDDELNKPMNFSDEPDTNDNPDDDVPFFNFDNMPPPAPMRFSDAPPASMHLNFSDSKPMKYEDTKQSSDYNTPKTESKPFSKAAPAQPKPEKKHLFGKKAKDAEALKKAEAAVNARKDVPNDGTWTCPNCGKVMPKYVGTCGCGESQPFEF